MDPSQNDGVTIGKIQELLATKNDTSRLVGLALLKSVLDNSAQLRHDEAAVRLLWQSVPPRFLDRLLRSSSSAHAKDMRDIAVAVLHTFSLLLPDHARRDPNLVGRIPALLSVLLHRSVSLALVRQAALCLTRTAQLGTHHGPHPADPLDAGQQPRRRKRVGGRRRCECIARDRPRPPACSPGPATRLLATCTLARSQFDATLQTRLDSTEPGRLLQGDRCRHALGLPRLAFAHT